MKPVEYMFLAEHLHARGVSIKSLDAVSRDGMSLDDKLIMRARIVALEWRACGYPRVVVDEKLAAALQCSAISEDVEWRSPWRTYLLQVGGQHIHVLDIQCNDGRVLDLQHHFGDGTQAATQIVVEEIAEVESERCFPALDSSERRVRRLAIRLVAGVAMMFKDAKPVGKNNGPRSPKTPVEPGWEPGLRTYQLSRPVAIDCRPSVREYLAGTSGKTVSVRTMVRGHWRNQVCGVGRGERRPTWIEPFWKGPLGAPVGLRPHVFKNHGYEGAAQ